MQAALSPTRAGEDDAKFYRLWAAWAAEYGPIYAICFGSSPRLVLTDATLIKEVTTTIPCASRPTDAAVIKAHCDPPPLPPP